MKKTKIVLLILIILSILSLITLYITKGDLVDGKLICNEEQEKVVKNMLIYYYNNNIKEKLNMYYFSEMSEIVDGSTTIISIQEDFDFNDQFYNIEYKLKSSETIKKYRLETDHIPELQNYIKENDSYKDYNAKIRLTYKSLIIGIIVFIILLYIVFHIAD